MENTSRVISDDIGSIGGSPPPCLKPHFVTAGTPSLETVTSLQTGTEKHKSSLRSKMEDRWRGAWSEAKTDYTPSAEVCGVLE